jgi:hypothetical protein
VSYQVEVFPSAEMDIQESAEWYEWRQPGLAKRFVGEVSRAIGRRCLASSYPVEREKRKMGFPKAISIPHFCIMWKARA